MSNDSNNNLGNSNDIEKFEKPYDCRKFEPEEESEINTAFNLRKRKKINYSVTRPDFIYESISDSDYDDSKMKK